MQKFVICSMALIAFALAMPQQQGEAQTSAQPTAHIIKQESAVHPEGYYFDFETSDGTSRQEQGTLKQISEDHKAIEVTGSYRYLAPDGLIYKVTFTAGEHGFQPQETVEHPGQQPQPQQYQQ